jgi:hypothetical protein
MKILVLICAALAITSLLLDGCGRSRVLPRRVPAPSKGLFKDVTVAAGVRFTHASGFVKVLHPNLLQTTGSGCAIWDYDGDGWLDLYLVDGLHSPRGGNRLYHNRRDGTFEDVTDRAGVRGHGYGMGCAVGDYNGDGRPDLYVTDYGNDILYRNNGDGTFTDVTDQAGVRVGGWSTAAAFFDADGDGDLDLYVGRYAKFDEKSKQLCETAGVSGGCNPSEYRSDPDVLLINDGHGKFTDGTRSAGIIDPNGRALGVLTDDYDGDGRPDIFVANDGTANYLFHNEGGGRFREVAVPAGVAYGEGGRAEASMGGDFGDYDGDGRPDLVIGSFQGEADSLYHNGGGGLFRWVTAEAGLVSATTKVLTFGLGFLDYDNDGDLDLAQANGHVHALVETIDPDAPYRQPRQLFENLGNGRFRDASADAGPEFTAPTVGRGMVFGDFDNDGDIDILTNNNGQPAVLLRNESRPVNHWLGIRVAPEAGRTEVGARVTVKSGAASRTRTVRTAYSFASANDLRVHFGLGKASGPVDVTVEWPGGRRAVVSGVRPDRYVTITPAGLDASARGKAPL